MDRMGNGNGDDHEWESPFLDRLSRYLQPEDEGTPPTFEESESPFAHPFVNEEGEDESPFLAGEAESPGVGEWEGERPGDPSLFDPAELEAEQERWVGAGPDEPEAYDVAAAPGAALFGESEWEGESSSSDQAEGGADGEIVYLRQEGEAAGEDGEFVYLPSGELGEGEGGREEETEGVDEEWEARGASAPSRVRGRILWPALGFPAVVAPAAGSREAASIARDSTRCITVLVLTDRRSLSKAEAARYLRIVPWSAIGRRHIPAGESGSFREEELMVRNDANMSQLSIPEPKGKHESLVKFGERKGGGGMIVGALSNDVRALYRSFGLAHLHEIRVSEEASARLEPGMYHVFWNNHVPREDAPSDEMAMLLERFAKPRRQKEGTRWAKVLPNLLREYEFEYGPMHLPYSKEGRKMKRAEILHPVQVRRESSAPLRISHITDLHVDVRSDVYEFNLTKSPPPKLPTRPVFNNWNRSVSQVYERARDDADIVLMTGDLVDYGRGHIGIAGHKQLADDGMYHRDRNWFLFYDIIAAAGRYTVPTYTSLGNHDWRLNPYPPFAIAGAPGVSLLVHNDRSFDADQKKAILRAAHGDGHGEAISYSPKWKHIDLRDVVTLAPLAGKSIGTMNKGGLPTETTVDSVIWYLLQINPFFDYAWSLPSGQRLLMLDWGNDEAVLFPLMLKGKEWPIKLTKDEFRRSASPGPKALRSLTATQKWLVQQLVEDGSRAKVIGMHTPPIGPYDDWSDRELAEGIKRYANPARARGPTNYGRRVNGKDVPLGGHPVFAIRPKGSAQVPDTAGMAADYGSFMQGRDWFIRTLAKPRTNVRAVLSGHIHRNGLLGVRVGTKQDGAPLDGAYLVHSLQPSDVEGSLGDGISARRREVKDLRAPLYVNTTCAGPRGWRITGNAPDENVAPGYARITIASDGRIVRVAFDDIESATRTRTVAPTREAWEPAMW